MLEPRPARQSDAEVTWLALAALAWLRHLDAALPAAARAPARGAHDAAALAALGAVALLRRAEAWLEAESFASAPAGSPRGAPERGDWLR